MSGFHRRGFLALLGTVAATAALDPERALWVPGARLISIPAAPRWYVVDVDLEQGFATFQALMTRGDYDALFPERDRRRPKIGTIIGDTMTFRRPFRFTA